MPGHTLSICLITRQTAVVEKIIQLLEHASSFSHDPFQFTLIVSETLDWDLFAFQTRLIEMIIVDAEMLQEDRRQFDLEQVRFLPFLYLTTTAQEAQVRDLLTEKDDYLLWSELTPKLLYRTCSNLVYRSLSKQQDEFLSAVATITNKTSDALEFRELLQTIVDNLLPILGGDSCYLTIWDEENQLVHPMAATGEYLESYRKLSPQPAEGALTHAVLKEERVLAVSSIKNSRYINQRIPDRFNDKALLGIPLIAGDEKVGAVIVSYKRIYRFSTEEITRAAQIATPLALAIVKGKLLYQEREQRAFVNALQSASAVLNASLDIDEVLDGVLEQIGQVVPYVSALILLVDKESAWIVRQKGYDTLTLDKLDQLLNTKFNIHETPQLRQMVEAQTPVLIADATKFAGWLGDALHIQSWLGIPIFEEEKTVAFICLDHTEPEFYTLHHLNRVTAFANHVSVAFHNAWLHQQTERQVRKLSVMHNLAIISTKSLTEDALLFSATRLIGETLFPNSFGFMLLDKHKKNLVAHDSYFSGSPLVFPKISIDSGIVGKVVRSGLPYRTGDVHNSPYYLPGLGDTHSEMCVPVRIGNGIVGVINVESRVPDFFSEEDESLMITFADHVGIALEKVRLLESERVRRRQAEIMRHASTMLINTLNIDYILEQMLDYIRQLVPYDSGCVMLLNDQGDLVVHSQRGYEDWTDPVLIRDIVFTAEENKLILQMINNLQPVHVSDTKQEVNWQFEPSTTYVGSWVGVPLVVGQQCIGCYSLDKAERAFFTEEHVQLIDALVKQTAVAVRDAQLHEETARQAHDLKVFGNILRELNAQPDISAILPRLDEEIRKLADNDLVSLLMLDAQQRFGQIVAIGQNSRSPTLGNIIAINDLNLKENLLSGQVHISYDLVREAQGEHEKKLLEAGIRSRINVPLKVSDQIIGSLNLGWKKPNSFNLAQLPMFQQIADAIGLALQRSQLFEEMKRWTQDLTMLHDLGRQIAEKLSRQEIFQTAVTYLYENLQYVSVSLFSVNRNTQMMKLEAIAGEHIEKTPAHQYQQSMDSGIVGRAAKTESYILINDTTKEPDFQPSPRIQVLSELAIPLRSQGQVIGVLNVDSEQKNAFDESDIAILTISADQIVHALQNASQLEQLQNRAYELEKGNIRLLALNEIGRSLTSTLNPVDIYRLVYRQIMQPLLHASHFTVAIYDAQWQIVRCEYVMVNGEEIDTQLFDPYSLGQDVISDAIHTKEVVVLTLNAKDTEKLPFNFKPEDPLSPQPKTSMLVPMITSESVLGVMIAQKVSDNAFSYVDQTIFSTLANQVSIALENSRLFNETESRATRLEALTALSRAMRAAEKKEEIIEATLNKAIEAVNGSLGSLYLIHERDGEMVVVCEGVYPHDPRLIGRTFALGEGITGHIALTGEVHITEDMAQSAKARFYDKEKQMVQKSLIRSGIGMPLYAQERINGVLYINLPRRHRFTAEEIDFLVAISEIAGSSLDRLLLLHTLEDRVEKRTKELQQANERLTELDQLKTRFVSDVSHELRTPITNLSLYLDLLENSKPEKRDRYMDVLHKQTDRLIQLIEDILSLSRLDMGPKLTFVAFDFNRLITGLLPSMEMLIEKQALTVELNLAEDLPDLVADQSQISQAVSNLLMNSVRYNKPNGRLRVTTSWDAQTETICLQVADTGMGISDGDKKHIFDRFYRGQRAGSSNIPGTGLGMAIVREIVQLHQGTIMFESQVDVGTTFTMQIPIRQT